MLIDINQWQILGTSVLVKRYEKPKQIGLLHLPDDYKFDSSWTLWEVVQSSQEADEFIGYKLQEDDILQTLRRIPPNIGTLADGTLLFVMGMHKDLIRGIVRWKNENHS